MCVCRANVKASSLQKLETWSIQGSAWMSPPQRSLPCLCNVLWQPQIYQDITHFIPFITFWAWPLCSAPRCGSSQPRGKVLTGPQALHDLGLWPLLSTLLPCCCFLPTLVFSVALTPSNTLCSLHPLHTCVCAHTHTLTHTHDANYTEAAEFGFFVYFIHCYAYSLGQY